MAGAQPVDVEPRNGPIDYAPLTANHEMPDTVSAAQQERGNRVAGAGETQLVEVEQREVGTLAGGDSAQRGTIQNVGAAGCCPA